MKRSLGAVGQLKQALTRRLKSWTGNTIVAADVPVLVDEEFKNDKNSHIETIPVEILATILTILVDDEQFADPLSVWAALSRTSTQLAKFMENEDIWRAIASVLLGQLPEKYTGDEKYDRVTKQSIKRHYDAMFDYWSEYLSYISKQRQNNEPWRIWKRLIEKDVRLTGVIRQGERNTQLARRWIRYKKKQDNIVGVELVTCPECPYPFVWIDQRVYVLHGFQFEQIRLWLNDTHLYTQSERIRSGNSQSKLSVVAYPKTLGSIPYINVLITTNRGRDHGDKIAGRQQQQQEEEDDDDDSLLDTIANHRVGILRILGTDLANPEHTDMAFFEDVLTLPASMHIMQMAASRDYVWLIAKSTPGVTGSLNERYFYGLDDYTLWSAVYDPMTKKYGSLHNHSLYDLDHNRGAPKLSPWHPICLDPHHEGVASVVLGEVKRNNRRGEDPFYFELNSGVVVTRDIENNNYTKTSTIKLSLPLTHMPLRDYNQIVTVTSGAGWLAHTWRMAPGNNGRSYGYNYLILLYHFEDAVAKGSTTPTIRPRFVIKYNCLSPNNMALRSYIDTNDWLVILEEQTVLNGLNRSWADKSAAVFINLQDIDEETIHERREEAPGVFTINDIRTRYHRSIYTICATTYHNGTFTTVFNDGISILSLRYEEWYSIGLVRQLYNEYFNPFWDEHEPNPYVLSSHPMLLDTHNVIQSEQALAIRALPRKW